MVFFTTVLSIDIRRMELSDLHKQRVHREILNDAMTENATNYYLRRGGGDGPLAPKIHRSKSAPGLKINTSNPKGYDLCSPPPSPTDNQGGSLDDSFHLDDQYIRVPRRVKFINFWARTRMMQRGIMTCVVVWILLIAYKSGLVEHLTQGNITLPEDFHVQTLSPTFEKLLGKETPFDTKTEEEEKASVEAHKSKQAIYNELLNTGTLSEDKWVHAMLLQNSGGEWKKLSYMHWPTLLGYYNISLNGRYITILPSMHLSMIVTPEEAIKVRHPKEPIEKEEEDVSVGIKLPHLSTVVKRLTLTPKTLPELATSMVLALSSAVIFTYVMTTLYKCMCTRNYAKWRASWNKGTKTRKGSPYYKQIREAMPLVLDGHRQEVECVVTDGPLVLSSCLGGQLRVWDSQSGECLTVINRKSASPISGVKRAATLGRNTNDSETDLYAEYHERIPLQTLATPATTRSANTGPPKPRRRPAYAKHSRHRSADFASSGPDLSTTIETDFASLAKEAKSKKDQPNLPPQGTLMSNSLHNHVGMPNQNSIPHSSVKTTTPSPVSTRPPCIPGQSPPSLSSNSNNCMPFPNHVVPHAQTIPVAMQVKKRHEGYNFSSKFEPYYDEHKQMLKEREEYQMRRLSSRNQSLDDLTPIDDTDTTFDWVVDDEDESFGHKEDESITPKRCASYGDSPNMVMYDASLNEAGFMDNAASPVWCMACNDNLIVAGCANGNIEFWDGLTGLLKFVYQGCKIGATTLNFIGKKVIVARLNGNVDFLEIETFVNRNRPSSSSSSSTLHNRGQQMGHSRKPSNGTWEMKAWDDALNVSLHQSTKAHQRPINVLQTEGGRVVTASQDHTLKVFRLEDALCLYTLHGHSGPVSVLFLDKVPPLAAASGSSDGTVRLWDLLTGSCVHKLQGHHGIVTSLTCTQLYVVSSGADDKLCIWERCKGHLLHWIQMEPGYCNTVSMLTSNLLVTGGQGCLYLWDVSKGDILRAVRLGDMDNSVFVRQTEVIGNSVVVSDYGSQLRVIHFPSVLEKAD